MIRYPRPRLWKPLDSATPTIRILHLDAPPSDGEPLTGSLQIWNLDQYPRYNAISWAWDAPALMSSIILDGVEGFRIPSKLALCLRHICEATRERSFWVDAICIDQFNSDERAQQVRLMEQIFSNANTVYVWLGSEQNSLHWLPEKLWGTLSEDVDGRMKGTDAERLLTSKSAGAMLLRGWWRRVWPMQEVILARNLKMCLGDNIIMDLESLRELVDSKKISVPQLNDLFWLADFRSRLHSDRFDKCGQLTILLHKSRLRETSDRRDRVYGLLGICTFLFGKDFLQPDYEKPVSTIYRELASRLIEKTSSLALLNQVVPLHHTDLTIPSWVPDLGSRYNFKPERARLNNWSLYCASRSIETRGGRRKHIFTEDCPGVLLCSGIEFGTITQVLPVCDTPGILSGGEGLRWYGVAIFSWFDNYQRWCQGFKREPGQRRRFVSTILRSVNGSGRIFADDNEAWSEFAQLCRYLTRREVQTESGRKLSEVINNSKNRWIREMLSDIQQRNPEEISDSEYYRGVSWWNNRCYENLEGTCFFMTADGRVGIGPSDTQAGDRVAVLKGGNLPYVLRKYPSRDYIFVGECYVHGAMQGEIGEASEPLVDFFLH